MFSNGWYTAFGSFTVKSFPFIGEISTHYRFTFNSIYSGVGRFLIRTPQFWSCIALTLVIYAGPVLTFRLWKNITKPNDSEKVDISLCQFYK